MGIAIGIIFFLAIIFTTQMFLKAKTKADSCPNCKKEYDKPEEWSFTEYSWGLRCPHCKYKFDTTP